MNPIVLRDKCYVPEEMLDLSRVETLFTRTCFDEGRCNTCEWYNSRPCDMCEDCPAYLGTYTLYNQKTVQGVDYIGLPLGARTKIRKLVPNLKDVPKRDLRCVTKFRYDIEFTGDLRDHQREAVDALKKFGYGVLKAPPRSGKTVMFIALAIELGYKTLILANQYDFLQQFYETLCGSATQESLTNIPDIEKFSGVKICGIANKLEDYFKYDICMCFPANTDVMIDYNQSMTLKNIYDSDSIQEVLAYDLEAKEIVKKRIVHKYRRKVEEKLWEVLVRTKGGNILPITCTWNHKFYTVNRGMVQAKDLIASDILITYDGDFTRTFPCSCGYISKSRQEHSGHTRMCEKHMSFLPYTCNCGTTIDSLGAEYGHSSWCNLDKEQRDERVEKRINSPNLSTNISRSLKKYYSKLTYEQRKERTSHLWGNQSSVKPSKPELIVASWSIPNLIFTGCTRKYRFDLPEVMKNPDFVYPNRMKPTKVIEVMDFNYWHNRSEIEWLKEQYKAADIECLVLDADFINRSPQKARGRVEAFLNNHYTKVISVRELRNTANVDVYTLEVEDVHNYFVVATKGNKRNHSTDACLQSLSKDATPILVGNSTYQTFISEMGQKRFARIKGLFGTVGVDEVHKGNATHFAKVLSNLHPKYKYGLTATPERKDGRSFLVDHIIGPVTHEVEIKRLRPEVQFIETGFSKEYKSWVYAMRGLEKSEARNELIVDNVFKQLKDGHSIVIPLCFRSHIDTLVEMINSRARRKIAEPFHGGQSKEQRTSIIIAARKGKVKVVVGMRQMIQLGINVPKWSAIFEVIPISNPPNHEQEVSRILTPMEGKPRPLILYFIDNNGAGKGCLRTCVFKTHVPLGHYISKNQWDMVGPYLRRRRAYDGEDDTPQMKRGRKSDIGKPSNRKTLLTKAGKRVL